MKLILASGSPRRRELLSLAGVDFAVMPARGDERVPGNGEPAESYALSLARAKAREVSGRCPDPPVLAADTVVWLGDRILGKPATAQDALDMLLFLRGRRHHVATAMVLVSGSHQRCAVVTADVVMRRFDLEEAHQYVSGGEPMDKAGAYAIQGAGRRLVDSSDGCYYTIVGLPLCAAIPLLAAGGLKYSAREWCSFCARQVIPTVWDCPADGPP